MDKKNNTIFVEATAIDPNKKYMVIDVEKCKRELEMKRNISHFQLAYYKTLFKNKQLTNYSYYSFFYYDQGVKNIIDELLNLLKKEEKRKNY